MMQCREKGLENALETLEKTDVPLLVYQADHYAPAGLSDDVGIYYFIPKLAQWLGISTTQAASTFFDGLYFLGSVFSLLSFFILFRSWQIRLLATAVILKLGYNRFFDVYSMPFIAILMVVPTLLVFYKRERPFDWKWIAFISLSGLIIGYSNFIRSHAGTGVFLFACAQIFFNFKFHWRFKALSIALLTLFAAIPYLHFNHLERQRDRFIVNTNPLYEPKTLTHVKWHQVYLGFSFFPNEYGILWDDEVAEKKVKSIAPDVELYSKDYEAVLKNEVMQIAKTNPKFVFKMLAIKTLKLLLIFVKFANIGLLLLFYLRPRLSELAPFLLCISFYSLPGVLVLPVECYLAGFITSSVIFGLYMTSLAIEQWIKNRKRIFAAT